MSLESHEGLKQKVRKGDISIEFEVLGIIYYKDVILPSLPMGVPTILVLTCPRHLFAFQSALVGVVVPDTDVLPSFAAKLGVKGSLEELCQNQVSVT